MSAYTETSIRIDKLSKEQVNKILDGIVKKIQGLPIYKLHTEKGADVGFARFSEVTKYNYKYANLSKEELNVYYNKCIADFEKKIKDTELVRSGEMPLLTYFIQNDMLHRYDTYVSILEHNGLYYINTGKEIFNNAEYDKLNINIDTVDALIEHLKNPALRSIQDLTDPNSTIGPLTPELEQKIRDYYINIGDHNFVVNFG